MNQQVRTEGVGKSLSVLMYSFLPRRIRDKLISGI